MQIHCIVFLFLYGQFLIHKVINLMQHASDVNKFYNALNL